MKKFIYIILFGFIFISCEKIDRLPNEINQNPYDVDYVGDILEFKETEVEFDYEDSLHYVTFKFRVKDGEMKNLPKKIAVYSPNYFSRFINKYSANYDSDFEFRISEVQLVDSGSYQDLDFYTYGSGEPKAGYLGSHSVLVDY